MGCNEGIKGRPSFDFYQNVDIGVIHLDPKY